jgi:hypothetical protein
MKLLEMGLTWHEDPRTGSGLGNYQDPEFMRKAKRATLPICVFTTVFPHGESASDV